MSRTIAATLSAGMLLSLALVSPALASSSAVDFGRAETFAVLGATGLTNTGPTHLSGTAGSDIGSYPTGSSLEYPFIFTEGHKYFSGSDVVITAQQDLGTAYDHLVNRTPTGSIVGDLGGQNLTTGIYDAPAGMAITGVLTLDAQENPDAIFIFQATTTLITNTSSTVTLINGAQPCNVVWQVGSSATLNTSSQFVGAIAASESISVSAGVKVRGQLLAVGGAVTLANDNTIINDACVEAADPPEPEPEPVAPPSSSSHQAPPGETGTVDGGVLPNTGSHAWIFALGAGIIAVALSLWAFARWRRRNQGHE